LIFRFPTPDLVDEAHPKIIQRKINEGLISLERKEIEVDKCSQLRQASRCTYDQKSAVMQK